jgi:hypothetical protein
MKNTDPLMGAKLKSKTHILNTFLIFEPFLDCLASKFSKSANMTPKKIFFDKNLKIYQKTQNLTLILNPLKKLEKMHI